MYKILLVEDEPLVRLAIKSLVDWNKNNFDVTYEASNGKKALDILKDNKDIDIVLTDINMPVMDGLELIKEIKLMGLNCEIVVLSAYDDYEIVRKAFKYGINDYILKNEMKPDNILELFIDIVKQRNENVDNYKEKSRWKKEYIKKLLDGNQILNTQFNMDDNVRIIPNNICVAYLLIDNFKEIETKYKEDSLKTFVNSIANAIEQVLIKFGQGEVISLYPEEYVVIFSSENNSVANVISSINNIISSIRYSLLNYLNISVTVGISNVLDGYENIENLFKKAEKYARLRYVLGKGKNISKSDTDLLETNIEKRYMKILKIRGEKDGISNALNALDEDLYLNNIERVFDIIKKFNEKRIEDIHIYYLELYVLIVENMEKDYIENIDIIESISNFETKKEIDSWFKNLSRKIFLNYKQWNSNDEINIIRKSKQYIKINYNKKINLEDVSTSVGLSKGYFSKLFMDITGENFTMYVNKIRIENAKKMLLNSNFKIYEISENIGFTNVEHFSRTFKKITGMSPKEFQMK
ncbi:MAG: response regulator [Clostridiaceae bacterium]